MAKVESTHCFGHRLNVRCVPKSVSASLQANKSFYRSRRIVRLVVLHNKYLIVRTGYIEQQVEELKQPLETAAVCGSPTRSSTKCSETVERRLLKLEEHKTCTTHIEHRLTGSSRNTRANVVSRRGHLRKWTPRDAASTVLARSLARCRIRSQSVAAAAAAAAPAVQFEKWCSSCLIVVSPSPASSVPIGKELRVLAAAATAAAADVNTFVERKDCGRRCRHRHRLRSRRRRRCRRCR